MINKNIRIFLTIASVIALTACDATDNKELVTQSKKPNILILFADQHNKKVMGFENHPDVITPNLDKLASESIVFDRAYCTVGICTPSRTSLLTGIYPRTFGIFANESATSVLNEVTSMATIFKNNGYNTYAFGKRHVSGGADKGWDIIKSHIYSESPDDNYVKWIEEKGYAKEFAQDWSAEFGRGADGSSEENHHIPTADLGTRISKLPEDLTMEAYTRLQTIEMIKAEAKNDKPFFCWATFYRPHQPYTPQQKYMDMYDVSKWGEGTKKGSSIKIPKSFYEPAENLPPFLKDQRNGSNKVWNMDKAFTDEQIWRNYIGAYYALVTEVDHFVGEILQALEDAGIEDETIVIYTADHGDFIGNHGMVEKAAAGHNVYEDILNIPLIIKYPGKHAKGKRSAELVSLVDILPTLIDLAGLETPELKYPIQGKSLADLIKKDLPLNREYIVSESWSQATVITPDYKLGIWLDPTAVHKDFDYRSFSNQFFVRAQDPLEIKNAYNAPENQATIEKLRSYYEAFKSEIPSTGKDEKVREATKGKK
jgi:arylsulfatase A-like enzyme